jgi:hypothetical protein
MVHEKQRADCKGRRPALKGAFIFTSLPECEKFVGRLVWWRLWDAARAIARTQPNGPPVSIHSRTSKSPRSRMLIDVLPNGAPTPEDELLAAEQIHDDDAGPVMALAVPGPGLIPIDDPLSDPAHLAGLHTACANARKLRELVGALEKYALRIPAERRMWELRSKWVMRRIGLKRRDRGIFDQRMNDLRKKLPVRLRERALRYRKAARIPARERPTPQPPSMAPRLVKSKRAWPDRLDP